MAVRERDNGARALLRRVRQDINVRVGIMGTEASSPHGDMSVVEIAAIHEFGLGHVPERSWCRAWADEKTDENKALMRRLARGVATGRWPIAKLADQTALAMAGSMQERISSGISPGLAPETIRRKGSSKPLIDTGQLRSSITGVAEVTDG